MANDYNPLIAVKQSYESLRILELPREDVKAYLAGIFTKDIMLKGIKGENLPNELITQDIQNLIITKYYFLAPFEISLALQMDRYGEFENKAEHYQFYGTEYIAEILKNYLSWKQKKAVEHNLSRKINSIEIKPDFDKIDEEYKNFILSSIKEGKEFRYINAHRLYESVPKSKLYSKKRMFELYDQEKKQRLKEIEQKKAVEFDKIKLNKFYNDAINSIDDIVKIRCRNIVVCEWLIEEYNLNKQP